MFNQDTSARPFFKPTAEHDTLNTAFLLWKMAATVVATTTGCWEWQASRDQKGYGKIGVSKKDWLVHRLLYNLCVATVSPSTIICHHCDNPPCCNLAHLYAGTQSDNMRDAVARGGHYLPCPKGGRKARKLSDEAVRDIRSQADCGIRGYVRQLAEKYQVSPSVISTVVRGHRYRSVPNNPNEGV